MSVWVQRGRGLAENGMVNHFKGIQTIKTFFSGNQRTVAVKKNIVGSLVIKGFSILISLMLVPMTLGYVSSELYGIWMTLSSIIVWLGFLDVGFTLGLKNKLAEALALGDFQRGKSLVSTTYFMMVLIFIPLCVVLLIGLPYVNWAKFLNIKEMYNEEVTKVLYVLVVCFCLQMIVNVLTAVVSAYQKVALASVFPVIGNFLALLIIYVMTKTCPPSLVYLALAISVMPVVVVVIASFILFHRKFREVAPNIRCIDKRYIRDLWNLGFKFFFIQIQVVVLYQCTNILISNVSGPNDVTSYNIAYKYMSVAMMLYTIILSPLWPAFTDAYTKKDYGWMRNIYKKMTYIYYASVLLLIVMLIVSPVIYRIWIGEKAVIPHSMTLAVALYMVVSSWGSLQVLLINGIGAVKLQTYVVLIGLVAHIPLSLFLGKYIGASGVVYSMTVINCIYCFVFTLQIRKILEQKANGIWLQ